MKEESKSVLKFNQRIFFTSQRIIALLFTQKAHRILETKIFNSIENSLSKRQNFISNF